jgi:hypothetical protein
MRKRNSTRKENRTMDERETRFFGYCENESCGDAVTDEGDEYYVNDDGEVFCCIECVLEHYGITKIEV